MLEIFVDITNVLSTYTAIVGCLSHHFAALQNVPLWRFIYHQRRQLPGEFVSQFVATLCQLWVPGPTPPWLQTVQLVDRCVTAVANRTLLLRSAVSDDYVSQPQSTPTIIYHVKSGPVTFKS